jgi:hypothetical protein
VPEDPVKVITGSAELRHTEVVPDIVATGNEFTVSVNGTEVAGFSDVQVSLDVRRTATWSPLAGVKVKTGLMVP